MIKAYLTAIPSLYEGEDIETKYCIYQDEVCLTKETVYLEYVKPAIASATATIHLLRKLKDFRQEKVVIIINDAALEATINGNNTTKNGDVIKMGNRIERQLEKFNDVSFINVTKTKEALKEWKTVLED